LTFPQFCCFYDSKYGEAGKKVLEIEMQHPATYPPIARLPYFSNGTEYLPMCITSFDKKYVFKLRGQREKFWRSRMFTQNDGESYYYQQIVIYYRLPIGVTFADVRGERSWREIYTHNYLNQAKYR
jgi:hypothetical protein